MNASNHLPLFTYGTLRRGEPNHCYLEDNYVSCLTATLRDYKRGSTVHGFSVVIPSPGGQVDGELFFLHPDVYAETMRRCDLLEDIEPGKLIGPYYRKAQVLVESTAGSFRAWAYVDPN
jgi:gamma-glutamylcyclotransferase (GGCT)/AIG2-like uncharacterized protein YtfP